VESFDDVLIAARAGDEEAVAVLYRAVHPGLARYLRARHLRQAEDLEAEVWLAVAERLHRFDGDAAAFRGWVYAIARKRLADTFRREGRRRTDPVPDQTLDHADDTVDPARLVLDRLDGDEAAAFVVRHLPAAQADVVLLRVLADLDVEQVAALLGRRPGTIRVMQHRGLRRLEEILRTRVTR
jgi:RNA polymerase sigma-70 factor (ECF subfamily)